VSSASHAAPKDGGSGGHADSKHVDAKSAGAASSSSSSSSTAAASAAAKALSGGALLGVDVEALTRLVRVSEVDAHDDIVCRPFFTGPLALSKFVRPLERRDEVETVLEEFLLAASEAADGAALLDGHHGFQTDADREAEQRQRAAHMAALEAEYLHAKVKIVDLGNACWTYKHFTEDIQTRQYRAPEVLLGQAYDASADIWSLACIVFELVTGDLLFDPQEGKTWDREEDHLAMMIELLGDFPRAFTSVGKYAGDYFNRKGELRHIHSLKYWGLRDVLRDKYKLSDKDAVELSDFMTPLLEVTPSKRATAAQALAHPWLRSAHEAAARANGGNGKSTGTGTGSSSSSASGSGRGGGDAKAEAKSSGRSAGSGGSEKASFKADDKHSDTRPRPEGKMLAEDKDD
jgi:serine/threonine protein kinase